jgi:hypothetical protein
MSAAEICHRAWQFLQRASEMLSIRAGPFARPLDAQVLRSAQFFRSSDRQLFCPRTERDPEYEAQLLTGRIQVFRHRVPARNQPCFWRTDPLTGAVWPQISRHRIDYRPGNATGDVRIVWELNRLQQLFALAVIAHHEPAQRQMAVNRLEADLQAWHVANPPGIGVNYLSAMEEALRLISLFHAYDLIRPWASSETRTIVAAIAAQHAPDIQRRLSLYSSAGNHTIAEATGLLYAGLLLPEYPGAARWRETGRRLLRIEAARQIDADGGGIEQATWYLLFITDLLGLAQALLAHCGEAPEPAIDAALLRSRRFLNALASGPDDLPRIGDADDGYALSPGLRISWTATGGDLPVQCSLPTAGLSVARQSTSERLVFLHNPLGMAPGYGHGHADCLSLMFRFGGTDVLIDPGTHQYGGSQEYRRYFRSAAAHNTVVIDGEDQAEQVAAFMWRRPFRSDLLVSRFESGCSTLLARHDGYGHLGITHWRGLIHQKGEFLAVWDYLERGADCQAALHWHLGVPASLGPDGQHIALRCPGGSCLDMEILGGVPAVLSGADNPLLGWRSVAYGQLEPCDVVRVSVGDRSAPVLTVLWVAGAGSIDTLLPRFSEFEACLLANSTR